MPIYEYKCEVCGEKNSFLEKSYKREKYFFEKLFPKNKCKCCGSKKLKRIISVPSVHKTQTTVEMLNDLSKMAPINFVPDYRMPGPPPGGCPYEKKEQEKPSIPEREKIVVT